MPESGTYGSVRGALSNERPYRDKIAHSAAAELVAGLTGDFAHAVGPIRITAWANRRRCLSELRRRTRRFAHPTISAGQYLDANRDVREFFAAAARLH
jgi:hypothetical protein